MSRGENQKLKLVYLIQIMLEKTDEDHGLTLPQILHELEGMGVTAERKSIYTDFADMTDKLGIEVIKEQVGRETYYHVGSRKFELAEVKLLMDAIQSSKFITEKKSRELIGKVKGFVSEYQAKQLQRQVYVQGRIKTMNESIYYNVDDIYNAIAENKKVCFQYHMWNIEKKLVPRREGQWYVVSPWIMTWDDENYYLVAFDDAAQKIKHYRVDKMTKISVLEESRQGKEQFQNFDLASYPKMNFGMYHGRTEKVKIEFENSMVGVFIDRFGKDITIRKIDEGHSFIMVDVAISNQFFGWIFSLGNKVKITGPAVVVEEVRQAAREFAENYF